MVLYIEHIEHELFVFLHGAEVNGFKIFPPSLRSQMLRPLYGKINIYVWKNKARLTLVCFSAAAATAAASASFLQCRMRMLMVDF